MSLLDEIAGHPPVRPLLLALLLGTAGLSPAPGQSPAPVTLVAVPWERLSNTDVGREGAQVLAIQPDKWRHAEMSGYILHFRRETEARKVARELEANLQFVARLLGKSLLPPARKPHAFVFEDQEDWHGFLNVSGAPDWSGSLAIGEDLYLNVRNDPGTNRFRYGTLAHEATHAAVARLYPDRRWPTWLNEGFAEYVAAAGVADRKNQSVRRHQGTLTSATLTFAELEAIRKYPENPVEVVRLYESSERLVRFLFSEFPPERFPQFVDAMLDGLGLEASLWRCYGDRFKDWDSLLRRYEQPTR